MSQFQWLFSHFIFGFTKCRSHFGGEMDFPRESPPKTISNLSCNLETRRIEKSNVPCILFLSRSLWVEVNFLKAFVFSDHILHLMHCVFFMRHSLRMWVCEYLNGPMSTYTHSTIDYTTHWKYLFLFMFHFMLFLVLWTHTQAPFYICAQFPNAIKSIDFPPPPAHQIISSNFDI